MNFDFARLWVLLLLPLAVLPLLRSRRDTVSFSYLAWLPADRMGQLAGLLWRVCAVLAIALTVFALAGPEQNETEVQRTGRGAEIVVLMDRSRSMDDHMVPSDWKTIDPQQIRWQTEARGKPKAQVARELLAKFVAERPSDRFSMIFFSTNAIDIVPFTQHKAVVQAVIQAGGVGPGLSDTNVGRALLDAIAEFDHRAYSGSRIILLVSDGGAQLNDDMERRIRAGVLRNRISFNYLYLRSFNGPQLNTQDEETESARPEIMLHKFFKSLPTPYHAYQAESPKDLEQAVADIGRQQNFPFDYEERVPRRDYSRACIAAAAFCCLILLASRALQLRSWT